MKQLHKIQRKILEKLLFYKTLTYSKIKPDREMENNQFSFHLNSLIKKGFVAKENSQYKLTDRGKEYANRMDSDIIKIKLQAKLSVWVVGVKQKKGENEYLIYTRLKHPFYGGQGFLAGKIRYGEKLYDAANRELTEETNLKGKPELVLIRHYRVFSKLNKQLLEDKFMFLCQVLNPSGELKSCKEGKYEWIRETELDSKVTNPFEGKKVLHNLIILIKQYNGYPIFEEVDVYTSKF